MCCGVWGGEGELEVEELRRVEEEIGALRVMVDATGHGVSRYVTLDASGSKLDFGFGWDGEMMARSLRCRSSEKVCVLHCGLSISGFQIRPHGSGRIHGGIHKNVRNESFLETGWRIIATYAL